MYGSKDLPATPDAIAPDGSEVRILLGGARGGLAHFQLAAGQVSIPVRHRTIDEVWYFVSGHGEMWLADDEGDDVVEVHIGSCVSIPCGTRFQFRAFGGQPLAAVGATMPPWPGDGEAVRCPGRWVSTVAAGPGLAEGQNPE